MSRQLWQRWKVTCDGPRLGYECSVDTFVEHVGAGTSTAEGWAMYWPKNSPGLELCPTCHARAVQEGY